jgi:hypothetical protein
MMQTRMKIRMNEYGYLIVALVGRTTHLSAFSGVQLSRYPISIFVTHHPCPLTRPRPFPRFTCPYSVFGHPVHHVHLLHR